jgi:hypothetical protein
MKGESMWKFVFVMICSYSLILAGGVAIPAPPGISSTTGYLISTQLINIGDFDGDGSDDILVFWGENPGTNLIFGVYSAKKGAYLLTGPFTNLYSNTIIPFGNFLGNGKSCFVLEGKLYSF